MSQSECKDCQYSVMRPDALEAAIPGLKILSSAYGSVRGETGLCQRHDKFVTASSTCADFKVKAAFGTKMSQPYGLPNQSKPLERV